jgi:RimJ/RimL family protein N-acetyltransferase
MSQRTFDNFGGHSVGGTPLPIPNRAVKPDSADGTRGESPRESRTPPNYLRQRAARAALCRSSTLAGVELTDGVVTLRPPGPADADWIVEACRDPVNQRWLPGLPDPYRPADAQWWLDHCRRSWEEATAAPFLVVDAETGARLGAIEARFGVPPDVGYWLAPEGRGRGAMTRALVLVSRYAFEERGLKSLELFTLPDNVASQRVAERAGYRREGTRPQHIPRRDGSLSDAYRYVLDRP